MNILVTGGAGYIGSVTAEALLSAGHRVHIADNLSEGHKDACPPGSIFHAIDLNDKDNVMALFTGNNIEAVMHFASSCLVSESMKNPARYFSNNIQPGLHLLEGMVKTGVKKIVFSSTCAVYGIPAKLPISEQTPLSPVNTYGESKLMYETILRWYHTIHSINYVSLRYFNAAGASANLGEDHLPETHLIPNVLHTAMGKLPSVEIYGTDYPTEDGTCVRDYIHVQDIADAHIKALEYSQPDTFNLGNGTGFSVKEIIDMAEKVTGEKIPVIHASRREGDPPVLIADAKKVRERLQWEPRKSSIEHILADAWQWHKKHPDGYSG